MKDEVRKLIQRQIEKDPSFHQFVLTDPIAALVSIGAQPPEDLRIVVVQDSANEVNLVLPEPELSESDLQTVSGGLSWWPKHTNITEQSGSFGGQYGGTTTYHPGTDQQNVHVNYAGLL